MRRKYFSRTRNYISSINFTCGRTYPLYVRVVRTIYGPDKPLVLSVVLAGHGHICPHNTTNTEKLQISVQSLAFQEKV